MPQATPTLEAEVQAVAENESRAMSTGDVALYLSLLDEDSIYLPPNASSKSGAELRAWLKEFLGNFKVEWLNFTHGQTVISGDLATHDYSYGMVSTPVHEGEPIIGYGKGLLVLRRRHGSWTILRNIWNAAPHQRPGNR